MQPPTSADLLPAPNLLRPLTPKEQKLAKAIMQARLAELTDDEKRAREKDRGIALRLGAVTPDEILQRSVEVRVKWDEKTCRRRAGMRGEDEGIGILVTTSNMTRRSQGR